MSTLESVFELISSLDQAEKRDFTKSAGFWSDKETRYERLYNFLNPITKHGEKPADLAKEVLDNKVLSNNKEINAVAPYLFEKILESLRKAPKSGNQYHRLLNLIQDIQILFYKERYSDCMEYIKSAKKIAKSIDKPILYLELLYHEKRALLQLNEKKLSDKLMKIKALEDQDINAIQEHSYYYHLYLQISMRQRMGSLWDEGLNTEIKSFINKKLPEGSITSQLIYHQIRADIYKIADAYPKRVELDKSGHPDYISAAFFHQEQIVELFMREKGLREEMPNVFMDNLDRFLTICLSSNRLEYFDKYKEFLDRYRNDLLFYKQLSYLYLLRFIKQGNFSEGIQFVEEEKTNLEKGLNEFLVKIPGSRLAAIYYACATIYFVEEIWEKAISWLEKIEALIEYNIRQDIKCMARVLKVIIQIETGLYENHVYKDQIIDTARQYLRSTEFWDDFLSNYLKGLKIAACTEPSDYAKALQPIYLKAAQLLDGREKESPFGLLLWWLECKVTGKPMLELKEKYL